MLNRFCYTCFFRLFERRLPIESDYGPKMYRTLFGKAICANTKVQSRLQLRGIVFLQWFYKKIDPTSKLQEDRLLQHEVRPQAWQSRLKCLLYGLAAASESQSWPTREDLKKLAGLEVVGNCMLSVAAQITSAALCRLANREPSRQ